MSPVIQMVVGRYSKVRVMGSIPGGIIIILSIIAFVTSILLSWGRGGVVLGVDDKFLFGVAPRAAGAEKFGDLGLPPIF